MCDSSATAHCAALPHTRTGTQAGGGADALLVADALYAFAQSAEARESGLRSRALAAEGVSHRERVAGGRHASALEEAEGLVSQVRMSSEAFFSGVIFFCIIYRYASDKRVQRNASAVTGMGVCGGRWETGKPSEKAKE